MRRVRQINVTVLTPDPDFPGTGAWTNPANIRDSGDPPVLDGTDATFASGTATIAGPTAITMRFTPPIPGTLGSGGMWAAITLDWEIVSSGGSGEALSAHVGLPGGTLANQFLGSFTAVGRRQSTFLFPATSRARVNQSLKLMIQAGIGAGAAITARVYEVGVHVWPRARVTVQEG